ncbi:unnamed protein product [Linum tenue]|uniref:BZIP domain-containing protein n=1 Tax=Linum tenue TaxID=586396 RepID=A0AAV0LQJ4_9ROSI|nr:unnamed protein product [Linum tenue]
MEYDDGIRSQIDWRIADKSPPEWSGIDNLHQGIQEIETHRDDEPAADDPQFADDFVAQFLVDFPPDSSSGGDPDFHPDSSSSHRHGTPDSAKDNDAALAAAPVEVGNAPNDPVLKKRQRQLRNRDAAVRSRERKKEYVKDLESKSKYLEWECRRLGRLLQCCVAENQALRFSLHNGSGAAFGAASAKQESAVLLLGMSSSFVIPAVGFPALVPGHHLPVPSTNDSAPVVGSTGTIGATTRGDSKKRRKK